MGKLQKLLNGRSPGHPNKTPLQTEDTPSPAPINPQGSTALAEGMARITNPSPRDVLFGRGKPFQSHPGNIYLHKIVSMHKERYLKSRRYDKLAIAEEIVSKVKDGSKGIPGRFLKRAEGEDHWVEVSNEVAREKVSHALRGKPRKVPLAASPEGFGKTGKSDFSSQVANPNSFAMELRALQAHRIRMEEQAHPSLQGHASLHGARSLFPQVAAGSPSPSLLQSLVGGGGGRALGQFSAPGMPTASGSLLPSNLDIMAARLAEMNSSQLQQQRLRIGNIDPSTLLDSSSNSAAAGFPAPRPSGMNESMVPGVDLALAARARAREEAIAMFAQNRMNQRDPNIFPGTAQGGFGSSQFPR